MRWGGCSGEGVLSFRMASFYHFRGNLAWLCRVTCMFVIIVSGKSRDDNIGSEGEEHASEPTAEPFTLSNGVLMNPKTAATESRVERLTLTKFDWKVSNGSDWFVKFYGAWPFLSSRHKCSLATIGFWVAEAAVHAAKAF